MTCCSVQCKCKRSVRCVTCASYCCNCEKCSCLLCPNCSFIMWKQHKVTLCCDCFQDAVHIPYCYRLKRRKV